MPELSMTGPVYSTPHSTHTYVLTLGAGGVVFVLHHALYIINPALAILKAGII
jgi:hypothetical protein